ncbi:hypothetical protein NCS55_01468400 [Fusarium keratoplasticum]|nr:hypothetical protein NCS55_01468400 [Fusarium keratoplasticum]
MTEYWRGLGVPDSIGTASAVSEADEVEDEDEGRNMNTNTELDWSAILSGGDDRPILNIEMSQDGAPAIERTWDVDSIISWASCLSINRGLYISYHPPASRNFGSSVHVFHQKDPLHLVPHFRLGNGRQSPQFGDERRTWIDRLLLPAVRHICPPDIIQHHPRSFDDVESNAYSRQRETCGGKVQGKMDMHHYLPQEYLQAIWEHMAQETKKPEMTLELSLVNRTLYAKVALPTLNDIT